MNDLSMTSDRAVKETLHLETQEPSSERPQSEFNHNRIKSAS
jgi:hypothetical protein